MSTFIGTNNDDTLTGTSSLDNIDGLAGNDSMSGNGGGDVILGGYGDDNIDGGFRYEEQYIEYLNGREETRWRFVLEDEGGNDLLDGGLGADVILGNYGDDTIIGGEGNDFLDGEYGQDCLSGGAGNDTLELGEGIDTVDGGGGNDRLGKNFSDLDRGVFFDAGKLSSTSNGAVVLTQSGVEIFNILGTYYNDTMIGGRFNDVLFGGSGSDSLTGGTGDDRLIGGSGIDKLFGGLGNDYYTVDNAGDIVSETAGSGTDQINSSVTRTLAINQENLMLIGGRYLELNGNGNAVANVITGSEAANILNGLGGGDSINGSGGKDILAGANFATFGMNEIDILTGGTGSDRFILGIGSARLYDNGVAASPGQTDYALITDFKRTQVDRLQLNGTASEYLLGATSPIAGVPGRPLYHDTNSNGTLQPATDELIAIIRSPVALTAANTINTAVFV